MTDLIPLISASLILAAPVLVAITFLLKTLKIYPSLFLFQILLADLTILVWLLAGIPVLTFTRTLSPEQMILTEHIGAIAGSFAVIFVLFTFQNQRLENYFVLVPRIGIGAFGTIMGAKLALILLANQNSVLFSLTLNSDSQIPRYTHPVFLVLSLVGSIALALTHAQLSAICYSFAHKNPELADPRRNKTSEMIFAVILPSVLISYLGSMNRGNFDEIVKNVTKTDSVQKFLSGGDFRDIPSRILRSMLVHKLV